MDVFSDIIRLLESEEKIQLATIILTSGSTPASAFSKMMIRTGGLVSSGTVGGGCMEGDVLVAAKRLENSARAEILTFHLNEDEYVQGLICGGTVEVLLEPLSVSDLPWLRDLVGRRAVGEDTLLATLIGQDGSIQQRSLVRPRPPGWDEQDLRTLRSITHRDLSAELHKALYRSQTVRVSSGQSEVILEPIAGQPSLLVFGGGHVSKALCTVASLAGFQVTVADDREQFSNPARFPDASRTIALPFLKVLESVPITMSTFVVIVTRGHQSDEEILEQVLRTPARYIGMIGSRRKVLKTYDHLLERGVTVEELRRVFAPVGIEIGAVTTEEIAVSIVAQLIRIRRHPGVPIADKSDVMKPYLSPSWKKHAVR